MDEIRLNNICHSLSSRVNKQIFSQCRQRREIYFYYTKVSSLLDKHFGNELRILVSNPLIQIDVLAEGADFSDVFDDVRLEVESLQASGLHHINQSKVQGLVGAVGHLGQQPRQSPETGPGVNIGGSAASRGSHLAQNN